MSGVRFPMEPLAAALGFELGVYGGDKPGDAPRGLRALCIAVGFSETTIKRWRRHGMTEAQADACAVAAGFHPCWIWGDLWWDSLADALPAPAALPERLGLRLVAHGSRVAFAVAVAA